MSPTPSLFEWARELRSLSINERRARLRRDWSKLRAPLDVLPVNELVSLFRSVGFVSDGPPQPVADVTIYRGAPAEAALGVSWSATEERGRWYANSYRTVGATYLWRAECPADALLGRFDLDDEVVVDPSLLVRPSVIAVAEFAPPPAIAAGLSERCQIGGH
jgi:hypothetical protein